MKPGLSIFLVVLTAILPVFIVREAQASGSVSLPYTNSFENYSDGYNIGNENGWSLQGAWYGLAEVTSAPDHDKKTPYLIGETHTNILKVQDITAKDSFDANTLKYVYIDMLVKPTSCASDPDTRLPAISNIQFAAYVNTNNQLVFYHGSYLGDPNPGYTQRWTTIAGETLPTNDWSRITVSMVYDADPEALNWACFQIQINGGPPYSDPTFGYSSLGQTLWNPCDGGPWFQVAQADAVDEDGGHVERISSVAFDGNVLVDDFVVSTSAPPAWEMSIGDAPVVTEGDPVVTNKAVFTVTVTPACSAQITVGFSSSNGTAIAGSDYAATNGTLVIPANETTGVIYVAVIADIFHEGDANEYFYVNLSNCNYAAIVDGVGIGSIADDDITTNGTPHSWIESYYPGTNYVNADWSDTDEDGMYAWEEYRAGTVPTDSNSVFRIISVGDGWTITWLGGTNQQNVPFAIYRSTDLVAGVWQYITNYAREADGTNVWTDTQASNYFPKVFHKITAPTNSP